MKQTYCKCGIPKPKQKKYCFVCEDLTAKERAERYEPKEIKKVTVQDKSVKTCVPVNTDAVDPHYFASAERNVDEEPKELRGLTKLLHSPEHIEYIKVDGVKYFENKPNTNYHWLLIAGIVLIVVGVILYVL